VSFPIAYRIFSSLPDRGFSFSRILGLLLWGFIFWLLTSLGILKNEAGSILIAFGLVLGISILSFSLGSKSGGKEGAAEILEWVRLNRVTVISIEIGFLLSFTAMAVLRAANPEILGTEKPMELMFINAILRSEGFPPHDAWLAGYAISYYYFGYVIVAMLAKITSVPGSIAFNLGISMILGLSFTAAMGLLGNIFPRWKKAMILAPLIVLVIGNVGGLLEVMHAQWMFWEKDDQGGYTSTFWKWLDITNLDQPPSAPPSWLPQRYYWWWQSSRVVKDYGLQNNMLEIIDEFPSFSFILGDLHPHVLAIPFSLLSLGLALQIFLDKKTKATKIGRFEIGLDKPTLLACSLILGGLAFLNTWDFPMQTGMIVGAYTLRQIKTNGLDWKRLYEAILFVIFIGISGFVLYFPFYLSFSSQAGGFIPNLIFPTRGVHFWIMFAPLLIPIFIFLIFIKTKASEANSSINENKISPVKITLLLFLGLFISSLLYGWILSFIPMVQQAALGVLGSAQWTEIFSAALLRRIQQPGTLITTFILCSLSLYKIKVGLTAKTAEPDSKIEENDSQNDDKENQNQKVLFISLLILMGTLLVTFPEFYYLRDQFGWRINTIFKFYYQAWLLWGIAAAAIMVMLIERKSWLQLPVAVMICIGLIYPVLAVSSKTNGFNPPDGWTLDGTAYYKNQAPDDYAALQWLQTAPFGVIAEAVGGSYSAFGRAATFSGLPNVLGWPGHESQWRGGAKEMGSREVEIERLYKTNSWEEAKSIIEKYKIRYIIVGGLERTKYNARDVLFKRYLTPVFEQGSTIIYETSITSISQ